MRYRHRFLLIGIILLTLLFVSCGDDARKSADETTDTGNTVDKVAETPDVTEGEDTHETVDKEEVPDVSETVDTNETDDSEEIVDTNETVDIEETTEPDEAPDEDIVIDECPEDPNKMEPGVCGCNIPEIDVDADGICDPSVYRITELVLMDPHLKISITGLGIDCIDQTNAVNDELVKTLSEASGDDDTVFKTNIIMVFRPLYQQGTTELPADVYSDAVCTNTTPWECTPGENDPQEGTYINSNSGIEPCLAPIAGTTNYNGINTPLPSCFTSTGMDITLPVDGFDIIMKDTQTAAFYDNDPAGALQYGLMRGFVEEEQIAGITIPEDTPIVGGRMMTTILPGGDGCPCNPSEADQHNGKKGWWFYLNFIAVKVDFSEPTE